MGYDEKDQIQSQFTYHLCSDKFRNGGSMKFLTYQGDLDEEYAMYGLPWNNTGVR